MGRFRKIGKRMAKKTKLRVRRSLRRKVRSTSKVVRVARAAARAVVRSNEEVKSVYLNLPSTLGNYTTFNNTIALADFVSVMPPLNQGVTQTGRVGNKIKLKGLYVKGHVNVTFPTTTGTLPSTSPNIYVRLFCLEDKSTLGAGVSSASILERNGVNTSFLGYPQDLHTPVDRKRFIVHYDKVIKLQNPNWSYAQSGVAPADVTTTRFFRFKVRGRDLNYDSNTDTVPTRFNPQFAAVVCDPTLVLNPNSTLVLPCQYTLASTAYFSDA